MTAAFLASAATSMVGGASSSSASGSEMATNAPTDARAVDPSEYFIDILFRSDHSNQIGTEDTIRAESGRIFAHALRHGSLPAADNSYLTERVAAKTGLS